MRRHRETVSEEKLPRTGSEQVLRLRLSLAASRRADFRHGVALDAQKPKPPAQTWHLGSLFTGELIGLVG
jgi:hypothetical protein